MPTMTDDVAGVLLAGGQARRMGGGDKCLRELDGKTILSRVIARARPQVSILVLNANGDPARFDDYELPVAADVIEGFAGPLAGVLTGLEWAVVHAPSCAWVASFATDGPFLPLDLVARLRNGVAEAGADMACAVSAGRTHPVFGLWPLTLTDALRGAMIEEGIRKIDAWTARYRVAEIEFPLIDGPEAPLDPFFNTNRPGDIAEAERFLRPTGAEKAG